MWTLLAARGYLQDRLADDSTTFWTSADLDGYINEAQRQISAITRGIGSVINASVTPTAPYFSLPTNFVGIHADGLYVEGGKALAEIPRKILNMVDPDWRNTTGASPLWVSFDTQTNVAYVIPIPLATKTIKGAVAVIPVDISLDSDLLFDENELMVPYLEPLLSLSVAFSLMKERYDNDAEKFYAIYETQLRSLGVNPDQIPAMPISPPVATKGGK